MYEDLTLWECELEAFREQAFSEFKNKLNWLCEVSDCFRVYDHDGPHVRLKTESTTFKVWP